MGILKAASVSSVNFNMSTKLTFYHSFTFKICLPLLDDLSHVAMRTRHWKQLVRVTGAVLTVDSDTVKNMTLGELLNIGLQSKIICF